MIFPRQNNVRRNCITVRPNTLKYGRPFSIALLYSSWSSASVGRSNNHFRQYSAHYKTSLVEVVNIFLSNPIKGYCLLYELKPLLICIRIFAKDTLVIDSSVETRTKGRLSSYEVRSPIDADRGRVAYAQQRIRHIFNTT